MTHSVKLTAQSPTIAEINLSAFHENVRALKKAAGNSMLLAVIKTNAYGHGTVQIGHEAVRAGAERLGVTTVEEGALLRESGITVPIHVLSSIMMEQAPDAVAYELTVSISSIKLAKAISKETCEQGKTTPVHLKIDTGLHRFGIETDETSDFCKLCYNLPGLDWEGIYTHFSSADEGDWVTTEKQFELFNQTVSTLKSEGYTFPFRHVGGSTIAIERKDMHLEIVRSGIALFGYQPEPHQRDLISLKPVMSLKSKIINVRELPPNTPIGYGGTHKTKSTDKIAVIPIGLGDGYQRSLSNKGEMLVRGKRAKVVGTITLDQTLIDVTHIDGVREGDEVVIMGHQGDEQILAREIAGWMGSIVDEVLASIMERIQRLYV